MKKILGRIIIVLPAIVLQIIWHLLMFGWVNDLFHDHLGDILNVLLSILAVVFVTGLVTKRDESSYKLLWVMVMVRL